jgi:hypothetical protein
MLMSIQYMRYKRELARDRKEGDEEDDELENRSLSSGDGNGEHRLRPNDGSYDEEPIGCPVMLIYIHNPRGPFVFCGSQ